MILFLILLVITLECCDAADGIAEINAAMDNDIYILSDCLGRVECEQFCNRTLDGQVLKDTNEQFGGGHLIGLELAKTNQCSKCVNYYPKCVGKYIIWARIHSESNYDEWFVEKQTTDSLTDCAFV